MNSIATANCVVGEACSLAWAEPRTASDRKPIMNAQTAFATLRTTTTIAPANPPNISPDGLFALPTYSGTALHAVGNGQAPPQPFIGQSETTARWSMC